MVGWVGGCFALLFGVSSGGARGLRLRRFSRALCCRRSFPSCFSRRLIGVIIVVGGGCVICVGGDGVGGIAGSAHSSSDGVFGGDGVGGIAGSAHSSLLMLSDVFVVVVVALLAVAVRSSLRPAFMAAIIASFIGIGEGDGGVTCIASSVLGLVVLCVLADLFAASTSLFQS